MLSAERERERDSSFHARLSSRDFCVPITHTGGNEMRSTVVSQNVVHAIRRDYYYYCCACVFRETNDYK